MNLVLDLGNSFGKIAVCNGRKVVESAVYEKITSREIAYFHARYKGVKGAIISSVVNDSRELIDYLPEHSTTDLIARMKALPE